MGVHATLDVLIILQDAVGTGEEDTSLGVRMTAWKGPRPGFHRWGLIYFLGPLGALGLSPRTLEVGSSWSLVAGGNERYRKGLPGEEEPTRSQLMS